jgi:peptidoglycan/xylan/chitin deacetylase (PgdA/CDA1 family)
VGKNGRHHFSRIPVLLYHRVDREADPEFRPFCVDPDIFAQQMAWLAHEGYETISLTHLQGYYSQNRPVPEKAIAITFDDGYFCNYSRAFPMMQAHGFAGTIFLATDLMREPNPASESRESFMSWQEIAEMSEAGFSFQSHGCSHRALTQIPLDEVAYEAKASKALIEEKLRSKVDYFCYPWSQYNEDIKRSIRQAGYIGACGGPPFWEDGPKDWFEIGRTEILWGDTMNRFRFKIKHGLGYYYFTKRQLGKIKRKLTL